MKLLYHKIDLKKSNWFYMSLLLNLKKVDRFILSLIIALLVTILTVAGPVRAIDWIQYIYKYKKISQKFSQQISWMYPKLSMCNMTKKGCSLIGFRYWVNFRHKLNGQIAMDTKIEFSRFKWFLDWIRKHDLIQKSCLGHNFRCRCHRR